MAHRMERRNTIRYSGKEGKYIAKDIFKGNSIAVFTSGGDAQGMNSAVRAVVRMGLYVGCKVYFIHEGYQGLVDGGKNIREASWADVSGIMQRGGTIIGSARCMEFKERAGRLKAAENLVKLGITNLCCIGGDGSLTGANLFRQEWSDLLQELEKTKRISSEEVAKYAYLKVVGMVGSIDNDFCGTDMTIGADSALHRIIEATDAITVTAHSHQRCFIMEVMGRHCGYLGLVASLASEADWVFVPEAPAEGEWRTLLCDKLKKNREQGQRVNIIIIAEGAIDRELNPITPDEVKQVVVDALKIDTRVTVLGHVQRGGSPSAFDRVLGIRMGAEAVLALMDANEDHNLPACVVSLDGNQAVRVPLMHCVEKTRAVAAAMGQKDFAKAVELRGKSFNNNLEIYLALSKICPPANANLESGPVLGIINVGAPACGVNAAMRSFVRLAITRGYRVLGIREGFSGLVSDNVSFMRWNDVRGWVSLGGSALGTRRDKPTEVGMQKVVTAIAKYKLSGLLVIGGFEAFECMVSLAEAREQYDALCIPMAHIPSTISNNLPGTEFTLGCDTALNEITIIIDKLKQSAMGTKRRVFVMETMGGHCGYLATMSGLAGGADAAYIFEERFTIDDLREDVKHLRAKIDDDVQRGLVLVSEGASKNYTADFIHRMYSEESHGVFDCRISVPGHMQQGGVPSPFDRNMGTKLGAKSLLFLDEQIKANSDSGRVFTRDPQSCCLVGIQQRHTTFTSVLELKEMTDFKHRLSREQWWLSLRSLMRIMAKHESLYSSNSIMSGVDRSPLDPLVE